MKQISLKTTGGYLTVIAAHVLTYEVRSNKIIIQLINNEKHGLNFHDEKIALTNYIMLQEYLAKPLTKEQLTFTFNF